MRYAMVVLAMVLPLIAQAAPEHAAPVPTYAQEVEIEYASPEAAAAATPSFAPVHDNKEWAFAARWDDSNPNSLVMREHMAKFGLKGTFYLTRSVTDKGLGGDFARKLTADGCSIGGHTMTHPNLTTMNAGQIHWEIMANRIEWEDLLDTPLNSFAFSYGQFKSPDNPLIWELTTEALRRTGYSHCVYLDFVRNNPCLAPGEFSSGLQVVPGDKNVDAVKFQESLDKIFKFKDAYAKFSRCIFLGVHPWQAGEEWDKLDAVYQQLSGKPDWWYCNQTEWAAFARQRERSSLGAGEGQGAVRRYQLTRPEPAALGNAVPLTLTVTAPVKSVRLDGQPVAFEQHGETVVANLPHAPAQTLPVKIGHVEAPAEECADFPGLKLTLTPDTAQGAIAVTLQSPADLRKVRVTFRLPLQYLPGILVTELERVPGGTAQTLKAQLPPVRPEAAFAEGPQYWVAEVEFSDAAGRQRVFVTRLDQPPAQ